MECACECDYVSCLSRLILQVYSAVCSFVDDTVVAQISLSWAFATAFLLEYSGDIYN